MASEVIKLNLIPKGEMPVFHASQFDTGRLITCELYRGEDAYSVPEGYTVELHCRKVDNNIVTMASTLINDNVVTFTSTEQLTACNGNNLCEVAILDEGYRIGTLNFILEVEIDPLKGGITSTSEIHNLETQIEEITTEIVGENYYNKTEVDDLLDTKADADSVYTIGEVNSLLSGKANAADVYTKEQVDTALAGKADVSDLPDMDLYYTKTATDTLLATKAEATTTAAALATKADKSDTYTKEQVDTLIDNIFPTLTASGPIAIFTTALTKPLISVTAAAGATTVTACGVNLFDGSKVTTTHPSNWGVTFENNNLTIEHKTAYSTGFPSIDFNLFGTFTISFTATQNYKCSLYENDSYKQLLNSGTQFTTTRGNTYSIIFGANDNTTNVFSNVQIETGNTASEYHAYTGNTVPVEDATTLTTQTGVNNVYADSGDVTVQYKYMSI